MTVAYDTGHYPARVPEQIGCIVGDLDVTLRIRTLAPLYTAVSELQAAPEQPVEWRRRHRKQMGIKPFALPPDTPWEPVDVMALKPNGKPWNDVTCTVTATPDGPMLAVGVRGLGVRDHAGRCPLLAGEQVIEVPFSVVTVD